MSPLARTALAVVAAGVVGTFANALAVAVVIEGASFAALAFSPGRLTVAILVAALLPVLARRLSGAAEAAASLALLTVVPSLLAKLVFGAAAPWGLVLAFNFVYALAAWATWRRLAPRLGARAA